MDTIKKEKIYNLIYSHLNDLRTNTITTNNKRLVNQIHFELTPADLNWLYVRFDMKINNFVIGRIYQEADICQPMTQPTLERCINNNVTTISSFYFVVNDVDKEYYPL